MVRMPCAMVQMATFAVKFCFTDEIFASMKASGWKCVLCGFLVVFVNFQDATFASTRPRKCISSISPIGCCDFSRFSSFFICVLESQNKSSQVQVSSVQVRSRKVKTKTSQNKSNQDKTCASHEPFLLWRTTTACSISKNGLIPLSGDVLSCPSVVLLSLDAHPLHVVLFVPLFCSIL